MTTVHSWTFGVGCCLLILQVTLVSLILGHDADIVKRQLRWNSGNRDIVSDTGSRLRINYLQPHHMNVPVLEGHDYMAFSVYQANGHTIPPGAGIFHFIDSNTAHNLSSRCGRPTMHAGAYYFFYGKCPEDERGLVASGYCFQGSNHRGLVFNSLTFNSKSMFYLDGHYYLDNNREVNSFEQYLITGCFTLWRNAHFPTTSWVCPLTHLPVSSKRVDTSLKWNKEKISRKKCTDCECSGY